MQRRDRKRLKALRLEYFSVKYVGMFVAIIVYLLFFKILPITAYCANMCFIYYSLVLNQTIKKTGKIKKNKKQNKIKIQKVLFSQLCFIYLNEKVINVIG